jgi:hypothetical protein
MKVYFWFKKRATIPLAPCRKIWIRIHTSDLWIIIQIREAQKRVDPVDLDPEHLFVQTMLVVWIFLQFFSIGTYLAFGFVQLDTEVYCCAGGGGREA